MLIYQYAYYWMIEIDRRRMSAWAARNKALSAIAVVETLALMTLVPIYTIVATMLGFGLHKNHLSMAELLPFGLTYFFALVYVNGKLLGSSERVADYKKIFDGWSKQKHLRWKIYMVLITVSAFVIFVLLANTSRQMLQP